MATQGTQKPYSPVNENVQVLKIGKRGRFANLKNVGNCLSSTRNMLKLRNPRGYNRGFANGYATRYCNKYCYSDNIICVYFL